MIPLSVKYRREIAEMIRNVEHSQKITPENVFQKADMRNRPIVDTMIRDHLLPGSGIEGVEELFKLHDLAVQGRSCLILMEHYSNIDLPGLIYFLSHGHGEKGMAVADSIIAMAGMKLNTESKSVLAFSCAYTRIVIYPSRSLASIEDPETLQAERRRGNAINRAALHEMVRCKHAGQIILVFPSGTRYRPGHPETKRGLKEIDSYLKVFDCMTLVGITGNILKINPAGEMIGDLLDESVMRYKVSPLLDCERFRSEARSRAPEGTDVKQHVADRVMEELERIHASM